MKLYMNCTPAQINCLTSCIFVMLRCLLSVDCCHIEFKELLVASLVAIGLLYTGGRVVRSVATSKRTGPCWEVRFTRVYGTECSQLHVPGVTTGGELLAAMLASACMFA